MKRIRALVFDFNGVIVNDEPIHNKNLQRVFEEEGILLTLEEITNRCHGRGDFECFTMLLREAHKEPSEDLVRKMIARKSRYYRQTISRHLPLVAGIDVFLDRWHGDLPLALASGALPGEIQFVLEISGLGRYFDVVAYTAEVEAPKPDPAVYRLTLNRLRGHTQLDLSSEECLVFEDSPPGLHAALEAGMRCVAVSTSGDHDNFRAAELVVNDFRDARLLELLKRETNPADRRNQDRTKEDDRSLQLDIEDD